MHELIDAVLRGQEVVLTHFGEPLAMLRLHDPAREAPPAWLEAAMLDAFDELIDFRNHGRLRSWRLS